MSAEIAGAELAVVKAGLELIRLSPERADETFNRMIRAAWAAVDTDEGGDRFIEAQRRDQTFDRLATLICARHAVSREAVQRSHHARGKPHVVAARMHLAHELRRTGRFSWDQIGRKLGVGHGVAMYYDEQHRERLSGANAVVTEEQAIEAQRLKLAEGLSWRQAAERLGLSRAKLKGRISWMKEQGKWPTK